jgi:hypothetical protein
VAQSFIWLERLSAPPYHVVKRFALHLVGTLKMNTKAPLPERLVAVESLV